MTTPPGNLMSPRPSPQQCPPRRPREQGVVIVLALLALLLFASLIFYIFNVGRHVQKKVETQNAADAAAISAAGWVARSYNTVAMNNVEMSRLIALAAVLDAVPQTVEYTLTDQQAVLDALDGQIARGVGNSDRYLEEGLGRAQDHIMRQVEVLQPMHVFFNESGYDVATMTAYESEDGTRGNIWEAFESLAAINEATMENADILAQHNAFRAAQINMPEAGKSSGGLMLPWQRRVPWTMDGFDAFRDPVIDGLLPQGQDDKEFNRGPFDTVFGWRRPVLTRDTREEIERDVREPYKNQEWVPPAPTSRTIRRELKEYGTWGMYREMKALGMRIGVGEEGLSSRQYLPAPESFDEEAPMVPSLWAQRIEFIADRKINFVFPGATSNRGIRQPQWITDYEGAVAIEESDPEQISYGFYLVYNYVYYESGLVTSDAELVDWGLLKVDPRPNYRITQPPNLENDKVANHIWRDQEVEFEQVEGSLVGRNRHNIRFYVFVGVNVGEEAEVRNPFNFDAEDRAAMPGPINFTPGEVTPEPKSRAEHMTYFGLARQPKAATFWPEAFDADRPDKDIVAFAQAEVFNNHSWDLWTQMWHAQLTPVDDFEGWVEQLGEPVGLADVPFIKEADVEATATYLKAVAPLADLMLEH